VQALAGISFAALVICAWWVGVRLLVLWQRRGGQAEALLGAMILCLMGLGYPLAVVAQAEAQLGLALCKGVQLVSNALIDMSFAFAFLFTWRVFRPDAEWARWLVGSGIAALVFHWGAVALIVRDLSAMRHAVEATRVFAQIPLMAGCLAYAWAAAEALHYHGLLRRRLEIGLVDPVTCNRILLFAILGIFTSVGALANMVFLLAHVDVTSAPLALFVNSVIGIGQAAVLTLAFVPPDAYARWVVKRAST